MIKIKEVGSFLYPNEDGFLEPNFPEIQPEWKEIVDKTIDFYRADLRDKIHSIYVRGSVAKGLAVKNVSDVDTYCVMKDDNFKPDPSKANAFNAKIVEEYPFCLQVELMAMSKEFILNHNKFPMIIKTQARCVYGENLADEIDGVKLEDMYHYLPNFKINLKDRLPKYLEQDKGNSDRLKSCCSWLMKTILRASYELIMVEERRWTNDLYLCHSTVAKRFPEMEEFTYEALNLALNPIENELEMTSIASKFYDFLEAHLSLVKTEIKESV